MENTKDLVSELPASPGRWGQRGGGPAVGRRGRADGRFGHLPRPGPETDRAASLNTETPPPAGPKSGEVGKELPWLGGLLRAAPTLLQSLRGKKSFSPASSLGFPLPAFSRALRLLSLVAVQPFQACFPGLHNLVLPGESSLVGCVRAGNLFPSQGREEKTKTSPVVKLFTPFKIPPGG